MKDQLISFELAKKLNWKYETKKSYIHGKLKNTPKYSMGCIKDHFKDDEYYYAPTQSIVQKSFRDNHKLNILIEANKRGEWGFLITAIPLDDFPVIYFQKEIFFKSYEEALEYALKTALEYCIER